MNIKLKENEAFTVTDGSGVVTDVLSISGKQDTLVSGTNLKTINNESLLGSGNISTSVEATYIGNTGTLILGDAFDTNDESWYALYQLDSSDYIQEGIKKEGDDKWDFGNVYSTMMGYSDSIYFVYKGENYYATEIRDMVLAPLSKTGTPISVSLATLNKVYITKDTNNNFNVYFETD